MAARRCSLCGINYPTTERHCRVCDEPTSWIASAEPSPDWRQAGETRLREQVPEDARVESWRIEQCLRLGYDVETSLSIAGSDADWHQLADLIGAGCPLEIAARIV